jgi:hypothetical protein
LSLGGIQLLKGFICDMDTTFLQSGNRDSLLTLTASVQGLKYYINFYTVGDIQNQKTFNFTSPCIGTNDQCRVSTLWKTGLCG